MTTPAPPLELDLRPPRLPSLAPAGAGVARWASLVVATGLGLGWLVVRPGSPDGALAVVDLLALPAILFAAARLLAGRTSISAAGFLVLFGLGAVLAPVVSLLVEGAAAVVLDPMAEHAFGSLVEVLAPVVPVVAVTSLLLREGRRPSIADLALAGLAAGLGFLVIQTSLITAASHQAPRYVTPLVAGWQWVDGQGGLGVTSYVGPAVANSLIGLGLGASIRWSRRRWRLVPPVLAVCLLALDRGVFDRELRSALTGNAPAPAALVELHQQATASGALALALLVLGLLVARVDQERPRIAALARRHASPTDEDAAGEVPRAAGGDDAGSTSPAPAGSSADAPPVSTSSGVTAGVALAFVVVAVAAAAAGILFVALARSRNLGFLQDRPVALAVSIGGFGYSLLRLANLRSPAAAVPGGEVDETADGEPVHEEALDEETLDEEPIAAVDQEQAAAPDEGPQLEPSGAVGGGVVGGELLCVAALAASALGIVSSLLPPPDASQPVHGALVFEAVEGWAAHVGHRGLLLGLAGLAAPPGPLRPLSGGGWADVLPWRVRSSGWWRALLGPGTGRLGWSAFWRLALEGAGGSAGRGERGRLPWLSGKWRPIPLPPEPEEEEAPLTTTITISPIDESSQLRAEYEGATVQEAMQAALCHLRGLSGTSLHLVDEGLPPKPGKPGSGRPARVRVVRSRDDVVPLLPPGRDSIPRATCLSVVVEIVDPARAAPARAGAVEVVTAPEAGPPHAIEVTLTCTARPGEVRTLTCTREEMAPGRLRYRSNPYSVDAGEDPAWVAASATPAAGLRVHDGEPVRVEYDDHEALVTVYDDGIRQVIGVNGGLLDVTAAHHVTALAEREPEQPGAAPDRVIRRLRDGVAAVEEARRLLASEAPDDEKAFLSTALLHRAMRIVEGPEADDLVEAAGAALEEHRREAGDGTGAGQVSGAYRRFLDSTVVGRLWGSGKATPEEIEAVLGLSKVSSKEQGW